MSEAMVPYAGSELHQRNLAYETAEARYDKSLERLDRAHNPLIRAVLASVAVLRETELVIAFHQVNEASDRFYGRT